MNRLQQLQKQRAAKERGVFWLTVGLQLLALVWIILMFAIKLDTSSSTVKTVFDVVILFLWTLLNGCLFAVMQIGEYSFFHFLKKLFFVKTK